MRLWLWIPGSRQGRAPEWQRHSPHLPHPLATQPAVGVERPEYPRHLADEIVLGMKPIVSIRLSVELSRLSPSAKKWPVGTV